MSVDLHFIEHYSLGYNRLRTFCLYCNMHNKTQTCSCYNYFLTETMSYDSASSHHCHTLKWAVHWYSTHCFAHMASRMIVKPPAKQVTSPLSLLLSQLQHPQLQLRCSPELQNSCCLLHKVQICSNCLYFTALTAGCRSQWSAKRAAEQTQHCAGRAQRSVWLQVGDLKLYVFSTAHFQPVDVSVIYEIFTTFTVNLRI